MTDQSEQGHKLILRIEVPDLCVDDLTAEYCDTELGGEFTPEDVFAEAFDENVVVTLLAQCGEDGPSLVGRDGRIVGFDVVPR